MEHLDDDSEENKQPAAGGSAETMLPMVYEQLRAAARRKLANEAPGQTLSATALVHEAYLRVDGGKKEQAWGGCGHYYAAAAEAMRRILIDRARRRKAVKRGGDLKRDVFDSVAIPGEAKSDEILAVHEGLDALSEESPRRAELVKLRYFVGLTGEEAAKVLGISRATAERDWTYARAWLKAHIKK